MPKQAAPAKNFKQSFFFFFISLGTVSLLLLATINIETYLTNNTSTPEVLAENTTIESEKEFWVSFLEENPEYIPGIAELARIEYELGNEQEAKKLVERINTLDPNHEVVQDLEDNIN